MVPLVSEEPWSRGTEIGELLEVRTRELRSAESVVDGVRMLCTEDAASDRELAAALVRVDDRRERCGSALKHAQWLLDRAVERGHGARDVESAVERLERTTRDWQNSFTSLCARHLLEESAPGSLVGDRLLPALTLCLGPAVSRDVEACARCTSPTVERVSPGRFGASDRVTIECVTCGPLYGGAAGGQTLTLRLGLTARGGYGQLELASDAPLHGLVVAQVRDKTKPGPFFQIVARVPGNVVEQIEFPIPADAGYDLYSARVVHVDGLRITFARTLGVLVPQAE
jgi:hypothetical protein